MRRAGGERDGLTGTTGRERDRARRVLAFTLALSLLLHLTAGGAWSYFGRRVASAVARYLPRPKPTPSEIVATSDAITITRTTTPREARRTPRASPPHRPAPRAIAQAPAPRALPLLTLAPLPTFAPTREPQPAPTVHAAARAAIHRPRPVPTVEPRRIARYTPPEHVRVPRAEPPAASSGAARGAFSARQIAALDARFSRTIADAQRSLTSVPKQRKPPATMKHYQLVMAGSRGDLTSAQGQCRPTQTWRGGGSIWHYMDCDFLYTDGFSEHVLIPWPQHYPPGDDPADHPGKSYVVEDPPAGFTLPHPFAFSRLVCIFYKSECDAVIARERASGDPAYAAP